MTRYLTRGNIFWGILLIALSSIDAFFTNYLLSTGMYQEANPMISLYANTSLYIKSIIWIPIIVIAVRLDSRISVRRMLVVLCIGMTMVCAWNAYQVSL